MKSLGTISVFAIVAFWVLMNGVLVWREAKLRQLGRNQRGFNEFLGNELRRERWMEIWLKTKTEHKKVGYTGFALEKVLSEEGVEYHASVETFFAGSMPLLRFFSKDLAELNRFKLEGQLILDADLKPLHLHVTGLLPKVFGDNEHFFVTGKREGETFETTLAWGEMKLPFSLALEDLTLSDGFAPVLPVAGFEIGETYRMRVFDLLTAIASGTPLPGVDNTAVVRVVEQRTEDVDGVLIDVYLLEMDWRGSKIRSLVTKDGEVIRQELGNPAGFVLERARSREHATKGFEE